MKILKSVLLILAMVTLIFPQNLTYANSIDGTVQVPLEMESSRAPDYPNRYVYNQSYSTEEIGTNGTVRVSDTIRTGSQGGSITITNGYQKDFGLSCDFTSEALSAVSAGVSFTINRSISTQVGYALNVGAYQTAYMAATPVYNVSTGTLYTYQGPNLISTQRVTIKSPSYIIYSLK